MRTTRHLIAILSLSGVLAYIATGCAAHSDESTDDANVRTLPATPDEVIPGYGVSFGRFPMTNFISNEYATLSDNRVPYARVEFRFDPLHVEKTLADIDREMINAAINGIHILPTILTPDLPTGGNEGEFLASLEIFTERLARTYGPHGTFANTHPGALPIRAWEIGNESNLKDPRFGFSVGNANAYRRVLRVARKGLRNGDPRARIVFGGLSSITNTCKIEATAITFLREVLTPPNRCLVDAVAYHPYAHTPEMAQQNANDLVDVMRNELHLIGGSSFQDDVQLWITELGWGITAGVPGASVNDEDQQAQNIRRIAFLSNQERDNWNLGTTLWYTYTDAISDSDGPLAHAGVYKSDGWSPHIRPAWEVIGNFAALNPWTQLPAVHICPWDGDPNPVNHDESDIELSTQMLLTQVSHQNGAPGTASVSGCVTADGTLNVNFQKSVNGVWMRMSTAQPKLAGNHYEVLDWDVGVGRWRVHAVFPAQGDYSMSEAYSEEFEIKQVPTETFLTLDGYQNGAPGAASVSGNVFRGGGNTPATGTVNVNFQKLEGTLWMTMSTAQRTLVNGHYEVLNWGAGLGAWRVRAVFPEQGDYSYSESNYHYFSIQRIATNTFLTLGQVINGHPGRVSTSGHVLRTNGNPASGTVNVNFQKLMSGTYTTVNTAQRILANGYYEVLNWGVGVGQWRVRAVFPEQGDYSYSESNYHYFSIQ